ncbi:MAG: DUF6544 family protein [Actinomycetes bacterium]
MGAVVLVHGVICVLGAAKAFGWLEVNRLTHPIGPLAGALWLVAAVLAVVAAVLIVRGSPSWWWVVAAAAAVTSQAAIFTSWDDAKAGTAVNVVLVLAAVQGFAALGPRSFAAEWDRRAEAALAAVPASTDVVTEADLLELPPPVARYVRRSGAVGKPRVTSFAATVHGRIRSGPADAWMPFTGKQLNTYGEQPQRLFFLHATRSGLPITVFHVFDETSASMRGKALSLVPVLDASGPEMDRGETVTLFNDLAVFAPAALVDVPVEWEPVDGSRVRGTFRKGAQTVTAELVFGADGDLVDFVSDDRLRASADGTSFDRMRWNTPLSEYADVRGRRVAVAGEGKWDAPEPEGHFTYIEFFVDDIVYNVRAPGVTEGRAEGGPGARSAHEPARPGVA